MTLIEMLDTLDAEVSRLQAERAKLAAALDAAQQQLRALLNEPVPARSGRKPAKDTSAPKTRPARKRQALGKTLAQLRSAARREIV
jgi:outer membrane protein TolC